MATWGTNTKTMKGLALDQKLLASSLPLKLKAAVSGAGKVNPTQLMRQTEVLEPKQVLEMRPPKLIDGEVPTAEIPIMLTNKGLSEEYTLYQVGIYAEDPDEGDILYIIGQSDISSGEIVPAEAEMPGYSITWNFAINVSKASSVEVMINEAGKLTLSQADERYAMKHDTVLTGKPTAPTAPAGTSTNQIATTKFVNLAVQELSEIIAELGTSYIIENTVVTPEMFVTDETYPDFPYKVCIPIEGLTDRHLVEVVFSQEEASSGMFASVTSSAADGVSIYAAERPAAGITIPTIECRGTSSTLNGGGSGGGGTGGAGIATDEEVDAVIEDIFGQLSSGGNSEFATDDEVNSAINDVFGQQ